MRKNKLIYIGNFRPWWSTETYVAKSFELLEWDVFRVQEDTMFAKDVLRETKRREYKFILYTRTWPNKEKEWLKILENTELPTVSYHLDLYLGIEREKIVKDEPFFKSDYVFSADGGHQKEFKELGINHYFLSPGVFEKDCYFGVPQKNKAEVIFVGSYNYHREWDYRKILIEWLKETYKDRFQHYGAGPGGPVWGKDLNNLFASVKVVVGDSLYSPNYWSDRLSEGCGRGAFLIFPRIEGIEDEGYRYYKDFIPYQYGDWDSLKEIIDYYLIHSEERDKIRNSGMAFVKKYHTYSNKIQYILSVLEKNNWSKSPKYKYEDCLRPKIER